MTTRTPLRPRPKPKGQRVNLSEPGNYRPTPDDWFYGRTEPMAARACGCLSPGLTDDRSECWKCGRAVRPRSENP